MVSPYFLSCLLLLPLGTCFPLLGREEPTDGTTSKASCADLAGGHPTRLPWGSSLWPSAAHLHALLVTAQEPQPWGRACAGFRVRSGRRDDDSEATDFLSADGKKASSLLGTLAKELNGYNRKKGGFSFRFGRR